MGRTFRGVMLAVCGLVLAIFVQPGCLSPTQAMLDASLTGAHCDEIHGTAITVGTEAEQTEARVKEHFVHASTSSCDPRGHIGTLVITPSDETGRAAVVVVAAFGELRDATLCLPPAYASCIVARRRFSFVEHKTINLPIAIDPDCANVPCNAFSTCRKGKCVDANVDCPNGECGVPGELPDGGVSEAGVIDATVPGQARCEGSTLRCWSGGNDVACGPPSVCCAPAGEATCNPAGGCTTSRYCCADVDCPSGRCIQQGDLGSPRLLPDGGPEPGEDAGTTPPPDGGPEPPEDGGTQPTTDGGTQQPPPDAGAPPADAGAPPSDGGEPRIGLGVCGQ